MYRRGAMAAGVLAIFLIAGGAVAQDAAPESGFERILRTGELRVGVSGEQPPLNMTAKTGDLVGMEIALMRILAQSMGVEARFVPLPFATLLQALEKREIDLIMSGMTITPERINRAAFVGPYYTSGKSILTKRADLAGAENAEALGALSPKIVALAGSTSESFVRRTLPDSELAVTPTLEEAIAVLLAGEVDTLLADRETCQFAALRHPDAGLLLSKVTFTVEPMGIAVRHDDPRLANLLETYLESLEESGALATARDYWFENSEWVQDLR